MRYSNKKYLLGCDIASDGKLLLIPELTKIPTKPVRIGVRAQKFTGLPDGNLSPREISSIRGL